jgi:hypothetical protein
MGSALQMASTHRAQADRGSSNRPGPVDSCLLAPDRVILKGRAQTHGSAEQLEQGFHQTP